MKKILLLLTLLSSCAEKEAPSPTVTISRPASASLLEHFRDTASHSEALLLKVSTAALRAGITLPSSSAERCWAGEKARPAVRDACLLLWAGAGEENSVLAAAVRENLSHSRAAGVAAVLQKKLIGGLSLPELTGLLQNLGNDSVWLRSVAVESWVEGQGAPDILSTEKLLPWIQPGEKAGLHDWAAVLRTRFVLRPGSWHEGIGNFCDSGAEGEVRLRCWKLLGVMAVHRLPAGLGEAIRVYLPRSNDPDWAYFSTIFPILANRLQQNVIQEQP